MKTENGSEQKLSPVSASVLEILRRHTVFPWPILKTLCARARLDPANLTKPDLLGIIDLVADGVARFTSPEKGESVRVALRKLAR